MDFYMQHDCPESQRVFAILNFYQISFKKNDTPVYLQHIQQKYRDKIPKDKWPMLIAKINFEDEKILVGAEAIEKYLYDNFFISVAFHQTFSAAAKQGVELAENQVNKTLEYLFLNPRLTFQNGFRNDPTTFRLGARKPILHRVLGIAFKRIGSQMVKNTFKLFKHRKEYSNSRKELLEAMEEWKVRIGDKTFHGGDKPDEADFSMYGVLKAKYNSSSFQRFIEDQFPLAVYRWFLRMQTACRYEENRLMVAVDSSTQGQRPTPA
eukprot:TRINITY_DN11041_c0_g1_i2.p1 TRINITY_DN11041_c0_g1~~TRINITY_DN11041_c0_g1_i2.p1  ORF type:complete len:265 (+),score=49.35 TRINITY_DN11041_c0_g1_i2:366-1160(+)